VIPPDFLPGLRKVFKDVREDRDAAIAYCREHDSPIARMVVAGIKRLPRGLMAAEKAIEDAGGNEALKLRRNMRFLYALGSVATLLGLIGTISGMIKAFQVAAVAGVGRVDQLSTGIYEAMVNTFGGLAVAIVVTIFYYFFVGRIERLIGEINDALASFSDDYGFNAESEAELSATATL
jgi:biopolymer transport protein ExbB